MTSAGVSVVMPAYDAERTIGAAISSVLWQDAPPRELIVVDDGSRDATASIASSFPSVTTVSHGRNRGVAAARNTAIERATGEVIAFCDADDILFPNHLSVLSAVFRRSGGIATSNYLWLFPSGVVPFEQRYGKRFPRPHQQRTAIIETNFVSTLAMFPRRLVEEIGGFDTSLDRAEDWDFWARAVFAGHRIALQSRPTALYRYSTSGLSADRAAMGAAAARVLEKICDRGDLADEERDLARRALAAGGAGQLYERGLRALATGDYGRAARCIREAASLARWSDPKLRLHAKFLVLPRLAGPLFRAVHERRRKRRGLA